MDDQVRRMRELAAEHARVADFSAKVHDEVAALHEQLDSPLLNPEQLREHAAESRRTAAHERAVAAGREGHP